MIDLKTERDTRMAKLAPVLCAECGHPVSHMDPRVPGALAGGMCTRCRSDRQGKPKVVYTYVRLVDREP